MAEIFLIRHAESETNAGNIVKSNAMCPLTVSGKKQSILLAKWLNIQPKPDLIIKSPFVRTNQTAQPYIDLNPNIKRELWDNAKEFAYLSQIKYTSINDRAAARDKYWNNCDIFYNDDETTESFTEFIYRIYNLRESLYQNKNNIIFVFTHGLVIKTFWWLIQHNQLTSYKINSAEMAKLNNFFNAIDIPNCGILKIKDNWLKVINTLNCDISYEKVENKKIKLNTLK